MGMSGNNTKIAQSRFGEMKFPPNDRVSTEVRTYFLPKDEIVEMYGPTPRDIFPREMYQEMRENNRTQKQMAEVTGLNQKVIYHLCSQYGMEEKKMAELAKNDAGQVINLNNLTREKYIEFKEQGLTDLKIARKIFTNPVNLSNWKKDKGLEAFSLKKGKKSEVHEEQPTQPLKIDCGETKVLGVVKE